MHTVVYFTDSREFGGAEQALLHLLAGLDRGCWRPVLMHHAGPGLAPLLAGAHALDVTLQAVPPMPLGHKGALRIPFFWRALRALRPAVFHAQLTWPLSCKYALMGALAARIPAVVATSQLFIQLPYGRLTRLQLRLLAAGIGRYIAVSQAVREQWQTVFGIPAHKLCVIHNAIPAHLFVGSPPIEPLPVRSPSGHPPTILTVARLDAQKGLTYLLDAAALVPQARFWLAGEGPERTHLEEQARRLQLGERVTFLGHRQDIATLLATCDLFVLPSLFEGLPLALLEAMAAGKPVIASAIAGIKEVVVDQKSGWLIPPADAPALAQAINTLLVNPGLADRYAQAGQRHVQAEFALESMVKRVTQIYTELLGGEQ